jgi:hypothetical protein
MHSPKKLTVSFDEMGRLILSGMAYAILDAATAPKIVREMNTRRGDMEALSLFKGTHYRDNWAIAPYLVRLDQQLFDWIRNNLADQAWGIVLYSQRSQIELFQHFRRFVTVRLPDSRVSVFRFYDPRVLPIFLCSREAAIYGFWNGVAAFGWLDGSAITMAQSPGDLTRNHTASATAKVLVSAELTNNLAQGQVNDFTKRCIAYLEKLSVPLPTNPGSFIESVIKSAKSNGIVAEIDLVRFANLVLTWEKMKSLPAAREIITYPDLAGSDKVDLLCEMAAFSVPSPECSGLDVDAVQQASAQFLVQLAKDKRFQRIHPDGVLTMASSDTRWRKQWIRLYTQQVAARAKVTQVAVGSTVI